jgi:pimeloyl-ACP methyl ester carboxylesterase
MLPVRATHTVRAMKCSNARPSSPIRRRSLGCVLVVIAALSACSADGDESTLPAAVAVAQDAACVVDLGDDSKCGVITVPEDYSQPDGRRIKLPYLRFPARQQPALPDPIVYVPGGPGASALALARLSSHSYDPRRDLIFLEVRGATFSEPSLKCDAFNLSAREQSAGAATDQPEAVGDCYRTLSERSDLSDYRTAVAARDFTEARKALGYATWNVYGGSYGTTLASVMMRTDPEGIRSVILDAVSPPQLDIAVRDVTNTLDAITRLTARCRTDQTCAQRLPNARDTVITTMRELNDQPWEIDGSTVGGSDFFYEVQTMLQQGPLKRVPAFIDAVARRDESALTGILEANASTDTADVDIDELFTNALLLSVYCADLAKTNYGPDTVRTVEPWPDDIVALAAPETVAICRDQRLWPVPETPDSERAAVRSDIPTLIIYGEWDSTSSSYDAEQAASGLANSRILAIPETPHGFVGREGLDDCSFGIVAEFFAVEKPNLDVDASCVKDIPRIVFEF